MPPKKIQIITLKKPQKLAEDFVPRNLKVVSEAIEKVYSISLDLMKDLSSSNSNNNNNKTSHNLFTTATAAYCRETSPNDVSLSAERLALNNASKQLWEALIDISQKRAEEFVKNVLELSSSKQKTNNDNDEDDDVAIMQNISRLWLCWVNAVHFIQHLLSWLERAPQHHHHQTSSSSNNNNNHHPASTHSSSNGSRVYYSANATIRSVCFSIMSDKLLNYTNTSNNNNSEDHSNNTATTNNNNNSANLILIQRAVNGFMLCLLRIRKNGDTALPKSTISEMCQLKTVLKECGCYGDETEQDEEALYKLVENQQQVSNNDDNEAASSNNNNTNSANSSFLLRYIQETLNFYQKETQDLFSGNDGNNSNASSSSSSSASPCERFVRVAQTRLNEERQRAHYFLTQFSRSFADAAVQKTIISGPYEGVIDLDFNAVMNRVGSNNNNINNNSGGDQQQQQQPTLTGEQILKRLYFLSGLPNVSSSKREKLLAAFKLFVSAESTMIISTAQTPQQELQMIPSLLQLYTRCDSIVITKCFGDDASFRLRFREAMEKSLRHRQSKVAELVARQFDILLREGDRSSAANALLSANNSATTGTMNQQQSSSSENTTLAALEKLSRFAKLVPAKDIFETFYMRDLAKRLLQFRNLNDDLEHTSISRLKVFCGPQVATRCNGMMKDIELSREFSNKVSESLREFDPSGKLEPLVLTQGYWPAAASASATGGPIDVHIPLPKEFSNLTENFYRLYCADFKKRKLVWSPVLSSAVIKARFPKGNKELTVSFIQTHILLLLNSNTSMKEEEIKETLYTHHELVEKEEAEKKLKEAEKADPAARAMMMGSSGTSVSPRSKIEAAVNDTVDCALISLTASKILNKTSISSSNADDENNAKSDSSKPTSPTTTTSANNNASANVVLKKETGTNFTYSVNEGFVHRQVKIRIAQVQKRQQEQSAEDTIKSTLAQRSHTVDAGIARIMKARKKIGHWDLVTQTIESTKLPLDPADVKKRIEALIDKDFMKRDSEDPSLYIFVA